MLKKIFLNSLFIFVLVFTIHSQRNNLDQLKKEVIEAQTQKEKAEAMLILGTSFSPRDTEQIFSYADSILLLAEADDLPFYEHASIYLDAIGHYKKGNLAESKKLLKKSLIYFSKQDGNTKFQCLNFLGISYLRTNQVDSAIIAFNHIISESNDSKVRLSAHGNLGRAYRQVGNYEEAISNFEKCVWLDSTNQFSKLNSYMNIATIFMEMEMFEKGIEIMTQEDVSKLPPQPIVAAYFNNLGEMYFQNNQYDSAIKYLNKGFVTAKSVKQNQLTLKNRMILSEIYLNRGNMDSSLSLLKAIKNDLHFYPAPSVRIDFNLRSAHFFFKEKEYDSAIIYAKRVLKITETNALQHQAKNSHELIAQSFEAKGNTDSSAFYYKKHAEWQVDTQVSSKEKLAQDAKARYMLAQKEKQIQEEKAASVSLKVWQKMLIGALVLILIITFSIFRKFKKSRTKVEEQVSQNQILSIEIERNKNEIIELKSRAIISIDDIISIKADGHYLEFNLISKSTPEVDRNQIKQILSHLPSRFVQIHRSYVVNVDHIKIKQATKIVLKDGSELPVSRTFKEGLSVAMDIK